MREETDLFTDPPLIAPISRAGKTKPICLSLPPPPTPAQVRWVCGDQHLVSLGSKERIMERSGFVASLSCTFWHMVPYLVAPLRLA